MNAYMEMKNRHQEEVNSFPMVFAFGQQQFEEAMKKLGLKPTEKDKVTSLYGAGDIFRKTDVPAYLEMVKRHRKEREAAIAADETGKGFIFEMFDYELGNHEYGYTGDPNDTLDALGITYKDLESNPALMRGFKKACKNQTDWYDRHK